MIKSILTELAERAASLEVKNKPEDEDEWARLVLDGVEWHNTD